MISDRGRGRRRRRARPWSTTARASPPELLDKVHEPFFTTKPGGTGPGPRHLPLARLAERRRPRDRSEPGEGTRVAVDLRLAGEAAAEGGPVDRPPASWSSTTIPACAAPWSASWRRSTTSSRRTASPRRWGACRGRSSTSRWSTCACRTATATPSARRSARRRPQTDVILITGSISEPDEKLYRSLEEGAFYFLFKPFDRRVLRALVERCLRLQRERHAKERYAQTLADDLEKARRFQHSLLPRGPVAGGGLARRGAAPLLRRPGRRLLPGAGRGAAGVVVAVTDVVGHGVSAAMYAGMLRSTLDAARRRSPEPARVAREPPGRHRLLRGRRLRHPGLRPARAGRPPALLNAGHPPLLWQTQGAWSPPLHRTPPPPDLPRPAAARPGGRGRARRPPPPLHRRRLRSPESRRPGAWASTVSTEAFAACRSLSADETLDALMDLVRDHCAGRPVDGRRDAAAHRTYRVRVGVIASGCRDSSVIISGNPLWAVQFHHWRRGHYGPQSLPEALAGLLRRNRNGSSEPSRAFRASRGSRRKPLGELTSRTSSH